MGTKKNSKYQARVIMTAEEAMPIYLRQMKERLESQNLRTKKGGK